jgi:hypothetical protein
MTIKYASLEKFAAPQYRASNAGKIEVIASHDWHGHEVMNRG